MTYDRDTGSMGTIQLTDRTLRGLRADRRCNSYVLVRSVHDAAIHNKAALLGSNGKRI